jgi:hypothetical protein
MSVDLLLRLRTTRYAPTADHGAGHNDPTSAQTLSDAGAVMAIVWPLLILAIFVALSVRRYRHLSR